jgi:glycosyltransferase involved in cell wall biosynthesis
MTHPRLLVIGDPASVFIQTPVRYWRDRGVDVAILAARWDGPATVDGDLPVLVAEAIAPASVARTAKALYPLIDAINTDSLRRDPGRVATALAAWRHTAVPPSLTAPLNDALLIAAAVDILTPDAVFGHEAFAHGLATAICGAPRRTLFAWGADVLQYAAMSDIAFVMVRQALHGVRYVLTNSAGMEDALHERFDLPRSSIAHISYGVDRRQFTRASGGRAAAIRAKHGIPANARIVMNLRRFLPHWGSQAAWESMATVAAASSDIHLVLLGGAGSAADLALVSHEAHDRGLSDRLTIMAGDIPLSTVAELMSVADVAVSLVASLEPVSWSVLQAAACGCALVLGDQRSYEDECGRGLAAVRVPVASASPAAVAIRELLDDRPRRTDMAAANDRFVRTHHDHDVHLTRLLKIVAGASVAEEWLAGARLVRTTAGHQA